MTLIRRAAFGATLLLALLPAAARANGLQRPFDVRYDSGGPSITAPINAVDQRLRAILKRSLGAQGVVRVDPLTGTPRVIQRTDGYLSGPAQGAPADVFMRFAKAHADVLGLSPKDFGQLTLQRQSTGPDGVTSFIYQQTYNGIPSLDTSLRGAVDRQGRVVWIGGSPLSGLKVSTTPLIDATKALQLATRLTDTVLSLPPKLLSQLSGGQRTTQFSHGSTARLVLVNRGDRVSLAWQVWLEAANDKVWDVVIDATNGSLIRRVNRVLSAYQVKAWDNYPGAPKGGGAEVRDMTQYFTKPDRLQGNYAHVFLDTENDDVPQDKDEVRPDGSGNWAKDYTSVVSPLGNCAPAGCSWNHIVPDSWMTNLAQNAQQAFYFVNHFADHLKADPVGFDEASGNFQAVNATGKGKANDALEVNTTDGAASAVVIPNPLTNALNANMLTPADGTPPRMQMYLFEPLPLLADGFSDVNGGDDASIVYHEFTHGLTNRLVLGDDGNGALISPQAGAMGEAWSDFYAEQYLLQQGFQTDTDAPGEVKEGVWTDGGQNLIRTEPVDCTLGADATVCPRNGTPADVPQKGGYAYDAFGKIFGSPEPHADGEIWVQTLLEIRRALVAKYGQPEGDKRILQYVTGGLRLSPPEPSFLDERNAILQADTVLGARDHDLLWKIFAARGMGFYAGSANGFDEHPTANFATPPAATVGKGALAGALTNVDGGGPVAGVRAGIGGFDSLLPTDFSALSGADGKWKISNVPEGGYGPVVFSGAGFEPKVLGAATIKAGAIAGPFNAVLKRNWVMLDGGASIVSTQGRDLGCSPALALDANQGTGAEFPPATDAREKGPKAFVVKLPAPIDVTNLVVNPTENCFDDITSELAGYKVEFSKDGTAWSTANEGTFTTNDRKANDLPIGGNRQGVRFVRMTLKGNQGQLADPTGTTYSFAMDLTELSIYGKSSDTTAPAISLSTKNGAVVKGPNATFKGKASDDNGVVRTLVNGGSAVLSGGAFSVKVPLSKGTNTVLAEAYDGSGNRGVATIKVKADLKPPKLSALRAGKGVRVRGRVRSTVTGRVSDDVGVKTVKVGAHVAKVKKGRFKLQVVISKARKVTVRVTDKAGRVTKKTVKVARK